MGSRGEGSGVGLSSEWGRRKVDYGTQEGGRRTRRGQTDDLLCSIVYLNRPHSLLGQGECVEHEEEQEEGEDAVEQA